MGGNESKQDVLNETVTDVVMSAMSSQSTSGDAAIVQVQANKIKVGALASVSNVRFEQLASINLNILSNASQSADLEGKITTSLMAAAKSTNSGLPSFGSSDEQTVKNIVHNNVSAQAEVYQETKLSGSINQDMRNELEVGALGEFKNSEFTQEAAIVAGISNGISNELKASFDIGTTAEASGTAEKKSFIEGTIGAVGDMFGNMALMGIAIVFVIVVVLGGVLMATGSSAPPEGGSYNQGPDGMSRVFSSGLVGYTSADGISQTVDGSYGMYREQSRRPVFSLRGGGPKPMPIDYITMDPITMEKEYKKDVTVDLKVPGLDGSNVAVSLDMKPTEQKTTINKDTTLADMIPKKEEPTDIAITAKIIPEAKTILDEETDNVAPAPETAPVESPAPVEPPPPPPTVLEGPKDFTSNDDAVPDAARWVLHDDAENGAQKPYAKEWDRILGGQRCVRRDPPPVTMATTSTASGMFPTTYPRGPRSLGIGRPTFSGRDYSQDPVPSEQPVSN